MGDILGDLISGLIEQKRWGCLAAVVGGLIVGAGVAFVLLS